MEDTSDCENNNPKLGFKIATIIVGLQLYREVGMCVRFFSLSALSGQADF